MRQQVFHFGGDTPPQAYYDSSSAYSAMNGNGNVNGGNSLLSSLGIGVAGGPAGGNYVQPVDFSASIMSRVPAAGSSNSGSSGVNSAGGVGIGVGGSVVGNNASYQNQYYASSGGSVVGAGAGVSGSNSSSSLASQSAKWSSERRPQAAAAGSSMQRTDEHMQEEMLRQLFPSWF